MHHANHDLQRARHILQQHAARPLSTQALLPGLRWWFDPEAPALVAYREAWGHWIVAGPPIAPPEHLAATTERLLRAARRARRRVAFFGLESHEVHTLRDHDPSLPWDALPIGAQPTWDPTRYDLADADRKSLRAQVRRASRHLTARPLAPQDLAPGQPDRLACERLLDAWRQQRRMALMGFLVALHPFDHLQDRRAWIAEDDQGQPFAFLITAPIAPRAGWMLEHLIRHPNAPNGAAELLVHTALTEAAQAQAPSLTLGLAPLANLPPEGSQHPALDALLRASWTHLNPLYGFQSLHRFKLRFRPHHTPTHLLVAPRRVSLWTLAATLRAFAGASAFTFALDSAARLLRNTLRRRGTP